MTEYTRALVWFLRYLPELASVPEKFIHAPWTMTAAEQQRVGCVTAATTRPRSSNTPCKGRWRWHFSSRRRSLR